MQSLLDRSVHCGYGCFVVDFRSHLQATYNLSQRCKDKQRIIIWYTFQACCITGYRDITPGSELLDHPSNICHQITIDTNA